jgi:peptide/nickel transport system substrate-binding protein
VVGALAGLAALGISGGASAQTDGEKLVLTVGTPYNVDSMNPLVGVTVSAYEVWNLQYATLTDKADADFSTTPGLAESWKGSKDGKTWTYKLRPDLKWSDGQPLTSEDIVYTVNRAREEQWLNHDITVANITAEAPDPVTVVLKSKVPDPKLPTMDVYILPKHVWAKQDADAILKYRALDGVGSGPFTLDQFEKGQFWRMKANPNYHGGRPTIDEVVFRRFNNADAMVAALQRGEVDAAYDVPSTAFPRLEQTEGIVALKGAQGSFEELGINGGDGLKKPHPALLEQPVREAIAHAIDKKTISERALNGLVTPADTISPSANPDWMPEIPADLKWDFDLERSKQLLEDAGFKDTDGDGIREMPGGGQPLKLRMALRSESQVQAPMAEFIGGWLRDIGIATTQRFYDDSQLTEIIGKGDYDLMMWGWTPFVDPEPMLNYFTCGQVAADPANPTNYYNDANYCDKEYDRLYEQQRVELDPAKRRELVHQMLTRFYRSGVYHALFYETDLQAYRTDRFEGWVRQPAETGPVMFSNSSHSYAALKPVAATAGGAGGSGDGGGGGGGGSGGLIAIVVAAVLLLGGGAFALSRRRTADERE